jgi:glycosyltransferase involved in cell wall biosynthesis
MKLLVITQALDTKHPILGFFHRWVEELASQCEVVHVICLEAGTYTLPSNVIVHSLGKEKGKGKLSYLFQFYSLIISLRKEYDAVFVHMNQVYVLLGAPLWRFFGKKIGLWYAHGTVSTSLRWAEKYTHYIFTCSKESFRLESKKVLLVGHGIDTARFLYHPVSKDLDLITVGRITPAKHLHTLLEYVSEIRKSLPATLTIAGVAVTPTEQVYEKEIKAQVTQLGLESVVTFVGAVSQPELPALLSRAKVFVTVAQNGSLDKAMLEALACSLPVVSMAPGSASLPLGAAQAATSEAFVAEVKKVLESGESIIPEYAAYVAKEHGLTSLIPRIIKTLS